MRRNRHTQNMDQQEASTQYWDSYADLITSLLLTFFLLVVIYILLSQNDRAQQIENQATITDLADQVGALEEETKLIAQLEALIEKLKIDYDSLVEENETLQDELGNSNHTIVIIESEAAEQFAQSEAQIAELEAYIETLVASNAAIQTEYNEEKKKTEELDQLRNELTIVLINIGELEKENEGIRKKLEEANLDKDEGVIRLQIVERITEAMADADISDIIIIEGTGDITFNNSVLFEVGKDSLLKDGERFLNAFLPAYFQSISPHLKNIEEVQIIGFASEEGEEEFNLELSSDRAMTVAQYLYRNHEALGGGIDKDTLRNLISVVGRGTAQHKSTREESRRVEIKFRLRDQD